MFLLCAGHYSCLLGFSSTKKFFLASLLIITGLKDHISSLVSFPTNSFSRYE